MRRSDPFRKHRLRIKRVRCRTCGSDNGKRACPALNNIVICPECCRAKRAKIPGCDRNCKYYAPLLYTSRNLPPPEYPVYECFVSRTKDTGLILAVIARQRSDGNLRAMITLLDLWKKGIRDCLVITNVTEEILYRQSTQIAKSHNIAQQSKEEAGDREKTAGLVTDDLVSHWSFDLASIRGKTLKDVWGENHGTIEGSPRIAQGKIRGGLRFSGRKKDRIIVPHHKSLNLEGRMTLCAWIYWNGRSDIIVTKRDPLNYQFSALGNKTIQLCVGGSENERGYTCVYSDRVLVPNTWVHIAVVRDRETVFFYKDGEHAGTEEVSSTSMTNERDLIIGSSPRGYFRYGGILDELSIYDNVLTQNEIRQNFSAKKGLEISEEFQYHFESVEFSEYQRLIRHGYDIAKGAKTGIPWEFNYWRNIVGNIDEVPETEGSLYKCPKCAGELPQVAVDLIKQHAQSDDMQFYIVCRKCSGEFD